MTTLSLPVYSRREEDVDLIGVAGVDIPIKLLNSLIPHHTVENLQIFYAIVRI